MTANECARPERIDTIGSAYRTVSIVATAEECVALAARFGLRAVEELSAALRVWRDATGIVADGRVRARVVQACVVTDESVATAVDEPIAVRFVAAEALASAADEIELAADALDTISYNGPTIDLGEAVAETMALALDPFPRSPAAAAALAAAGVVSEESVGPFGALAALRDKMGG
ncbi:MAG: hypothetical protein C0476_06150 [Sphingomonas sp.]|nr:hypothetical protein [Sphingomonas sp.]